MWHTHSHDMYREKAEGDGTVPLHNIGENEAQSQRHEEAPESGAASASEAGGTWGERDVNVNPVNAMQDYAEMKRELTQMSETKSTAGKFNSFALKRSKTGGSRAAPTEKDEEKAMEGEGERQPDEEDEEEFALGDFLRDGHLEKRQSGKSAKRVGVIFKHLTVQGVGASAMFVKTLPYAGLGTFGPDLYRLLSRFLHFLPQPGFHTAKRDLISDFTGVVRDGEMLLVLGRPGSGCSTFLKTVANKRGGFAGVSGEVSYGGIPADIQSKRYRGEVNYNPEDDEHLAALTVEQTLKFSLLNKTRKALKAEIPVIVGALLKMFGISHTRYTIVGDGFVRGISGGERKRVSIAETLATKSSVISWDNTTRGLDASTALDYAKSLRIMTDVSNRTTIVTLYQAGEDIYKLMDKVLLIDAGRMVYQGPASEAKAYFQTLGYYSPDRQTTADFLTACTDPVERRYRDDFEGPIPKGPIELEKAFRESQLYQNVLRDVEAYEKMLQETDHADARRFKATVQETKSKTVSKRSVYTVSFFRQVLSCVQREFWLTWGDMTTLKTKAFIIISNAFIVGSLFYGQSKDTAGTFARGGSLFFSIVFLGWLQLSELMKAVSGRNVISRHKDYAFYRPSAVVIARVVQDIPLILSQVIPFSIVMYFICQLDVSAAKFWIYFLFTYITTISITSLYRMFAALSPAIDDAVRFAGISLILLVVFTGYVIPKPQLINDKIWFGWLYYVNPMAYSFEAVVSDEFYDRQIACAPSQIVPNGAGYDNPAYQGCSFTGGQQVGQLSISGSTYLQTSYNYTRSHLWRNFGVVIAFTALYILVTALAAEIFDFSVGGGGALEFKRSKRSKNKLKAAESPSDIEKGPKDPASGSSSGTLEPAAEDKVLQEIQGSESVFTWENVEYSVPYLGGHKKLLNNAAGYVKPGVMIALMGASGAGKTTLLNSLSQRQKFGIFGGEVLVDGRPLDSEFQRGTGYCEQMDLHDVTSTIREALEFSAILRQDRNVPRAEKIAYVDNIIDLLELRETQDALIRSLGVEQRKRVTIGVELAARPNLLLFLDEPTSGLDSQSAYNIIRFLKKLAQAGQAIICTIHQPSTLMVAQFDLILALNPGGNTFYFGPVGVEGAAVIKYFADRGITVPPGKNIAEFILETAAKGGKREDGKRLNWNEEWLNSQENKNLHAEIASLKAERSKIPARPVETQHAFASPVTLQTTELTKRLFRQYWRSPPYLYGKLFVAVIVGIFNGFTFWQLGNTLIDLQDRMFSIFLIIVMPPTIVNGVLPKFYMNRALWEARELPSRIYGWFAFCTANIVAEIPMAILCATIYWALWYWPVGFPSDSADSGYVFLMTMLFFFFQASWGQWICAFTSSFTVISNILPFFFVMFSLFNGVVRPYSQLSVFWRYWMYYVNPSTYWISGVIASTFRKLTVRCAPTEAAYFNPPPGQSCFTYASDFVSRVGHGYLTNPDATENCGYCQYANGVEYMNYMNIKPGQKWRDFGIFLAFVCSNWALVYFFIYTVRIRGWTFGFGTLFKVVGMGLDAVTGALGKVVKAVFRRGGKKTTA